MSTFRGQVSPLRFSRKDNQWTNTTRASTRTATTITAPLTPPPNSRPSRCPLTRLPRPTSCDVGPQCRSHTVLFSLHFDKQSWKKFAEVEKEWNRNPAIGAGSFLLDSFFSVLVRQICYYSGLFTQQAVHLSDELCLFNSNFYQEFDGVDIFCQKLTLLA